MEGFTIGSAVIGKLGDRNYVNGRITEVEDAGRHTRVYVEWADGENSWVMPKTLWRRGMNNSEERSYADSEASDDLEDIINDQEFDDIEFEEGKADEINSLTPPEPPAIAEAPEVEVQGVGIEDAFAVAAPDLEDAPAAAIDQMGGRGNRGRGGRVENRGRGRGRQAGRGDNNIAAGPQLPQRQPPQPPNPLVARLSARPLITVQWILSEGVIIDPAISQNLPYYTQPTKFKWRNIFGDDWVAIHPAALKSPTEYFILMHPMQYVPDIISHTNNNIRRNATSRRHWGTDLSQWHYLSFLGISLARALENSPGDLTHYWASPINQPANTTIRSPDFQGRFGISLQLYIKILHCLRLDDFFDDAADGQVRTSFSQYNILYMLILC